MDGGQYVHPAASGLRHRGLDADDRGWNRRARRADRRRQRSRDAHHHPWLEAPRARHQAEAGHVHRSRRRQRWQQQRRARTDGPVRYGRALPHGHRPVGWGDPPGPRLHRERNRRGGRSRRGPWTRTCAACGRSSESPPTGWSPFAVSVTGSSHRNRGQSPIIPACGSPRSTSEATRST